jgi:hypothetical protein
VLTVIKCGTLNLLELSGPLQVCAGIAVPLRTLCCRIYSLRVSEHSALDCVFLELVPLLYRDVELEVVLHAACDSEPHAWRGSVTNCAGPAAIRLKVRHGLWGVRLATGPERGWLVVVVSVGCKCMCLVASSVVHVRGTGLNRAAV